MWFVAIAVVALLLLAALPLRLDFTLSSEPDFESQLLFTWAGFVRFRTALTSPATDAPAKLEPRAKPRTDKPRRRIPRSLYSRATVAYVIQCLRRLVRQTQLGPMQLTLRFGCDNPADTGVLFASLVPVQLLLGNTKARVTLEPCFWQECFEPRGRGQLTLVPLRYLAVLGSIALAPNTWRLAFRLAKESSPR